MTTTHYFTRKPCKCPHCGGKVASVLYGMPIYSEKLQADLDAGRIVLGGCEICEENHQWECTQCERKFYKKY